MHLLLFALGAKMAKIAPAEFFFINYIPFCPIKRLENTRISRMQNKKIKKKEGRKAKKRETRKLVHIEQALSHREHKTQLQMSR